MKRMSRKGTLNSRLKIGKKKKKNKKQIRYFFISQTFGLFLESHDYTAPVSRCRPVSAQPVVHINIAQKPQALIVCVIRRGRVSKINVTLRYLVGTFAAAQYHRIRLLAYVLRHDVHTYSNTFRPHYPMGSYVKHYVSTKVRGHLTRYNTGLYVLF